MNLWESRIHKRRPALHKRRGFPLRTKERRLLSAGGTRPATTGVERRNANVRYIFGLDPDRYLHCRSRWIVLHNLREKKIAATTAIVTAVTM